MKGKEYRQPKNIVRSPFCLFIRLATMQQPQRPSFRDLGVMRLHVNAGYYPPLSGLLSTTTSTNRHAPKYQENFVVPPVPPENLVTTLKSKATSHLPLQWLNPKELTFNKICRLASLKSRFPFQSNLKRLNSKSICYSRN